MELKSRSVANGTISILELKGRFDAYEESLVREWLNKVATSPHAQVIVNLAQVDFIDSTGLAILVYGMKFCRRQGGNLYLSSLQQPVRTIFQLTRLDKAFHIFYNENEAIKAFTKKRSQLPGHLKNVPTV